MHILFTFKYILDLYCLSKKLVLISTFKMIYNQKVKKPCFKYIILL